MNDPLIRFKIENDVARIVLNRPGKRNALSRTVIDQLSDAVDQIAADESSRLLIFSADGPVFCAGMDLMEMQQRASDPNAEVLWQDDARHYRDLLAALFTLPMPTVAVVQGPALAGGVGLVLACDIVLAAEDAYFCLPEPKRGITAAVVAPLLVYRIGAGPAHYLLLSAERVSAGTGHRMGLCHEVVAGSQLLKRAEELESKILGCGPSALKITKQHVLASAGAHLLEQLDAGMMVSAQARGTDEAREGLAAFLEKRDPDWQP